eukprot:COSAG06_NODE_35633_length_457_cov_1.650838_1_plen_93_part_00
MMKRLRLGPDADEGLNVGHVASTDWADAVAAVAKATSSKQGARSGGGRDEEEAEAEEEESMRPFTVAGEKTALRLFNLPFSIALVFVPSLSG